jgi:hypothetical protein
MGDVNDLAIQVGDIQARLNETHLLLEEAAGSTGSEAVRNRLRKADVRVNEALLWIHEIKRLWPAEFTPQAGGSRRNGTGPGGP